MFPPPFLKKSVLVTQTLLTSLELVEEHTHAVRGAGLHCVEIANLFVKLAIIQKLKKL